MTKTRTNGNQFAKVQPRDGDVVLRCDHLKGDAPGAGGSYHWSATKRTVKNCHFFTIPKGGIEFMRPDGTTGKSKWLVCCDECFRRHGAKFPVTGDEVWKGDEPVIQIDPEVN